MSLCSRVITLALFIGMSTSAANAAPLPESSRQATNPNITSNGIDGSFAGTGDFSASGVSVQLFLAGTDELLLGDFILNVTGLDLSTQTFTSGSFEITDNGGNTRLASTNLLAVGTDNSQLQFLFENLIGDDAFRYTASGLTGDALVLLNDAQFGSDPTTGFNPTLPLLTFFFTGASSDTAAVTATDDDSTSVPAPATLLLLSTGLLGLAAMKRKKRR